MKGYFRKRGNTWSYTIDVGIKPDTGDRDQATKGGFKTKKEAQLAAAALMLELDQGVYIKEANLLFKDFAIEWLALYQGSGVKVTTVDIRKYGVDKLTPYFAHEKMKAITRKMYQGALNNLRASGFADGTLVAINSTGRMLFKKAVELGHIKVDPTHYAVIPKTQKTVEEIEEEADIPKYLEKEELVIFLETARKSGLDGDYTVFKLLAYSGIRLGELCALKWKDIDFENHTINITKTYYNKNYKATYYTLLTPKTKKSKRTIAIDVTVLDELENHKALQNIYKMKHRDNYHPKDFIFVNKTKYPGYPRPLQLFEDRMTRILKLSKLNENLTPHSLRHTHTSLLAEAGVGLEEIMERLGHADDEITRLVYLHVTKTMKKEASQKFSELMRNL
jgi:integrase